MALTTAPCPHCQSGNTVKTAAFPTRVIYFCFACAKAFERKGPSPPRERSGPTALSDANAPSNDFTGHFPPRTSRPTVLVVDTDATILKLLADSLHTTGFDAVLASDAHTAVAILNCSYVDAAILEVRLAGRSGLEVLEYMRSVGGLMGLPVLMLTGVSRLSSDEEEIIRRNEAYLCSKADGMDQIAVSLRELMQQRKPPAVV